MTESTLGEIQTDSPESLSAAEVYDGQPDEERHDAPGVTGRRAPTRGRGLSRTQIRRVAAKAEEVAETDPELRAVAAFLVGTGEGIAELTTAIMASERSAAQSVSDLELITASDPMEAGVNAAALDRPRLKAVWSLLESLGASLPGDRMPSAEAKAAIAVAKAAHRIDDDAKAQLAAVVGLLKKS